MRCTYRTNGDLQFHEIDPFFADAIKDLFRSYDKKENRLAEKIFQFPCKEEVEFSSDWKEFIEPGLIELLGSCWDIAIADLKKMETVKTNNALFAEFIISPSHRESWLRVLNFLRLSLAEKYQFTKEEMDAHKMPSIKSAREMAVFQMQLLTMMQVCCIEAESDDLYPFR